MRLPNEWDYLIVTASNERQAGWFRSQLSLRVELGLITGFQQVLVIADPQGKRVGSCGSTIFCLLEVINHEVLRGRSTAGSSEALAEVLKGLRILIIHSGGDSRRLPAYGGCGKIFVPLPISGDGALHPTLLDRQLPLFQALPGPRLESGQIVIASGDALLLFDPKRLQLDGDGAVGLGILSTPSEASHHGVFCAGVNGTVKRFLQKPSVKQQEKWGAVDGFGQTLLDSGVFSFDSSLAARLLSFCGAASRHGTLSWSQEFEHAVLAAPLDFYREICCALGSEADLEYYVQMVRSSGSLWADAALGRAFKLFSTVHFSVEPLSQAKFLHFGTNQSLIESGYDLLQWEAPQAARGRCLQANNHFGPLAKLRGENSLVEGCSIEAEVALAGQNLLVGADVKQPLAMAQGMCVDVQPGMDPQGGRIWYVRCYGSADSFKESGRDQLVYCGMKIERWMELVGASPNEIWGNTQVAGREQLWEARLFPSVSDPADFVRWLWMLEPQEASSAQKEDWRSACRYSMAEILENADPESFSARRKRFRLEELVASRMQVFRIGSDLSAPELAYLLIDDADPGATAALLLEVGHWCSVQSHQIRASEPFMLARIMHTLGSAIKIAADKETAFAGRVADGMNAKLGRETHGWLGSLGLESPTAVRLGEWCDALRTFAFDRMGSVILASVARRKDRPQSRLRSDEIVWGRAPARLDLGGGWSDTPPYSLEHGGCVLNAAVDLNGQPPIQAYARVIPDLLIRVRSIDLGEHVEIRDLDSLLDYRNPTLSFTLVRAAFALSGFSPDAADWGGSPALPDMLRAFGGGIEMTTFAAIPKGSGLGTSSIMGAVVMAVIKRMMGEVVSRRELFHLVLRLEQALSTGGGWQDQIGGVVEGVKKICTGPGMVPEADIYHIPADVLDPRVNGGQTLLFYTGITRLAKNILQKVVGRYLDRERSFLRTLAEIHAIPQRCADAMSRKDIRLFGEHVGASWILNKQLDPDSSNQPVEEILNRIGRHVYGSKLLGAGGGGFLLIVCRSPEDARLVKELLEKEPPNERSRFFDFDISAEGLVVTVS